MLRRVLEEAERTFDETVKRERGLVVYWGHRFLKRASVASARVAVSAAMNALIVGKTNFRLTDRTVTFDVNGVPVLEEGPDHNFHYWRIHADGTRDEVSLKPALANSGTKVARRSQALLSPLPRSGGAPAMASTVRNEGN